MPISLYKNATGQLGALTNSLISVSLEDEDIKVATITALAQLVLNNLCVNEVIKVLEDETERITEEDIKGFADGDGAVSDEHCT